MNPGRLALAALGGTVAYFVYGGLAFGLFPVLRTEFMKYPAIYRSHDSIMAVMPIGMVAMLASILILSLLYAQMDHGHGGWRAGARFGVLIGLFAVCAFVVHNYVNLNIGWEITAEQAGMYFVQWVLVCAVIGVIYRPRALA
jgi:hypothetical protein